MRSSREHVKPSVTTAYVQLPPSSAPPCPLPAVPMAVYAPQQDSEPIYMTPSEVAQGYKHTAVVRDLDLDSVISEHSSLSAGGAEAVGGSALQEAKHNQLKRTHALQEKLRSWEASSTAGRPAGPQQNSLVMSTESGVFIEEMQDYDAAARDHDQQLAGSMLRHGEMTLAMDSPAGKQRVSQVRLKQNTPMNKGFMSVPEQEAWVVERMGKFHRVLQPGANMLVPLVDKVKYVHNLRQIPFDLPNVRAVTQDQVAINVDFMVFLSVKDPYQASYAIEDPEFAITQVATTTLRGELSKVSLDQLFTERERLGRAILDAINTASQDWGIVCLSAEIRDIQMPYNVQQALILQAEAERKKRAAIIEADGVREAEIKVAEGQKQSVLLAAEAARVERTERAQGEAEAMLTMARARAQSLAMITEAISLPNGLHAAALSVAEQYVQAFGNIARTGNTMILPAEAASPVAMITQAMSIFSAASAGAAGATSGAVSGGGGGGGGGGTLEGRQESLADSLLTETTATRTNKA